MTRLRYGGASPRCVPSLIKDIRPQITHERIESSTCPRQRLGIPHLVSISSPPCVRLLKWEVRRCLDLHEGGRVEKACSHNQRTEVRQRHSRTEYSYLSGGSRNGGCCFPTITPSELGFSVYCGWARFRLLSTFLTVTTDSFKSPTELGLPIPRFISAGTGYEVQTSKIAPTSHSPQCLCLAI